jgi:hypothetical protein
MGGLLSGLIGGDLVFSCTGRGVCESCDDRHMAQTAAHCVIRWFSLNRLLDAAAVADILAWENSGSSIDASVRITLHRSRPLRAPVPQGPAWLTTRLVPSWGQRHAVATTQQLGPTSRFWKTLGAE